MAEKNGDLYGTRTRVTAVKGRCLNRLTKRSHGRGDRIRTCGPMLPKHVRYQTAPHPGNGGCASQATEKLYHVHWQPVKPLQEINGNFGIEALQLSVNDMRERIRGEGTGTAFPVPPASVLQIPLYQRKPSCNLRNCGRLNPEKNPLPGKGVGGRESYYCFSSRVTCTSKVLKPPPTVTVPSI